MLALCFLEAALTSKTYLSFTDCLDGGQGLVLLSLTLPISPSPNCMFLKHSAQTVSITGAMRV